MGHKSALPRGYSQWLIWRRIIQIYLIWDIIMIKKPYILVIIEYCWRRESMCEA